MRTALRRGLGVFVCDATTGIPLIGGLLVCALAVAVAVNATHRILMPGWGDALNLCLYSCLYLAPASAGLAATHLARLSRSGALALADTAPDGRWRASRLGLLGILAWAWAAFTMLVVVAVVGVDTDGPGSLTMALIPVQGYLLILASTCVGSVVGRRFQAAWVAPVLTLAVFAVLYATDVTAGPLDRWSPTYSGLAYRVNTVPNTLLLTAVCLMLSAVAAVLLGVLARSSPGVLKGVVLLASVAALTSVLMHTRAGPADVQFREGGPSACTTRATIRLCVFKDSAPQLDAMAAALTKATQAAHPLFDVPSNFYQPDVDVPDRGTPVDVPPNQERGGQLVRAVGSLVPFCASDLQDNVDVSGLIFERIRPGITGPGEIAHVAQWPIADQRAWVEPRLARLESCP